MTTPILWSWDDPECEEVECPQCADMCAFKTDTLPSLHYKFHKAAVSAANLEAIHLADKDFGTGCSLSWEDLFLHHFAILYHISIEELINNALSDYQTECYRKSYDTDTFCGYHAEERPDLVVTVHP